MSPNDAPDPAGRPPAEPGREEDTAALAAVRGGPRLIVPSVSLRCPAGHRLELPAEYAARRSIFCPRCRRAFSPDEATVRRARRKAAVGLPGRLRLAASRRTGDPSGATAAESHPPSSAGSSAGPGTAPAGAAAAASPGGAVLAAAPEFRSPPPSAVVRADRPVVRVSPRAFRRLVSASGWVVSCAIHAALLLALALLGIAIRPPPDEPEVVMTAALAPEEEPKLPEQPRRRDLFASPTAGDEAAKSPEGPSAAELPRFEPGASEKVAEPEPDSFRPSGIDEAIIPSTSASGAPRPEAPVESGTIGVGRAPSGRCAPDASLGVAAVMARSGAGVRLAAARRGGGGADTESAVEKALEWLAAHQAADGSWRVSGGKDDRGDAARPAAAGGAAAAAGVDLGSNQHDLAASALATLAFLGAGYDGHEGKYKDTVARALAHLLARQRPAGCWTTVPETQEMHVQGIATLALVEACLVAPQGEEAGKLKEAAGRAVRFIADAQYPYSVWGYNPYAVRSSADAAPRPLDPRRSGNYVEQSVVIWNGMALKAARTAGIPVDGRAFGGIVQWLDDGQGADGNYAYSGNFVGGKVVVRDKTSSPCMAAAALMMRLWTGTRPDAASSQRTATVILDMLERNRQVADALKQQAAGGVVKSGPDLYFLHHGSIALFQMGGDHWVRWNRIMKPMVLNSQAEDGSWAPSTYVYGPVMATAFGALALESYYRYSPLYR